MARGKHSAEAVAARQAASRQEEATCGQGAEAAPSRKGPHVASFRLFAQSRDGRMLMFEDSHGHFTCVHARRLAP